MTTRYTVESILEESEDEPSEELRRNGGSAGESSQQPRPAHDTAMKANMGKGREREKEKEKDRERDRDRSRRHKSSKHTSKDKSKNIGVKRASGLSRKEYEEPRLRHRHGHSNRSSGSAPASSSEGEEPEDHRMLLAARSRLTSPSMVSTFTTQTTATNKSSSSSGSNSTVTQVSISKRPSLGKSPEVEEAGESPMSPAVPDPPNVFQFLEPESPPDHEVEDEERQEEDGGEGHEAEGANDEESEGDEESDQGSPQWSPNRMKSAYIEAPLSPQHLNLNPRPSSSASSSFHGDDNASEHTADVDTDRSSSPDRSVDGHNEAAEPLPTDDTSAKNASQAAAAQMQQFSTRNLPRGNTQLPHIPSSAISSRHQYHLQPRPLSRAEKLPVTGYELLASRLSALSGSDDEHRGRIKPMYRKFEALNHRLLLHLQDELSELEEQLHRLDHADTQSRRLDLHGYIIPASRRLAAQAGGELQWHKTDVLGKIGYKLNQYNQALSSFNSTQSLHHPDLEDIEQYRTYLQNEQPIAEAETHFLDPTDDLVSIYSEPLAPPPFHHSHPHALSSTVSSSEISSSQTSQLSSSTAPFVPPQPSTAQLPLPIQPILPCLASAIAISILVPILTFSVIPGFAGRLTVTSLVATFMLAALAQSGIVNRGMLLERESLMCAGIYGGVMVLVAGIVA